MDSQVRLFTSFYSITLRENLFLFMSGKDHVLGGNNTKFDEIRYFQMSVFDQPGPPLFAIFRVTLRGLILAGTNFDEQQKS